MTEFARQLRQLRRGPAPALPTDDFVARVMAACELPAAPTAAPGQGPGPGTARWLGVVAACAAAAAGVVVAGALLRPLDGANLAPEGHVTARGVGSARVGATVQAFVGRAAPGSAPALLEGAELGPGDGILVRYSNPTAERAYLMVFALDTRREVHWIHPAYLNDATNPTSLELEPRVTGRALDEVAEPENPATGPLRVYALLSDAPLEVKAVEAKLQAGMQPVHELFPQAEVEEWRCTWRAH